MPKSKTAVKGSKPVYNSTKFKIGGRKSNRSALRMTTEELQELLHNGNTRGRDKNKIRQVLAMRNIKNFSAPVVEAEE